MRYLSLFALIFGISGFAQDLPQKPLKKSNKLARQEWFYGQRAYPLPAIPARARLDALAHIERFNKTRSLNSAARPGASRLAITTDTANWTMIGPQPTGGGTLNATAGRINAIAVDPRDNNTVYLGAAEGGVWKTKDGGLTWTPLTDQQPSLANGAIVIDPSNPDTVYVGTGEENFAGDSYYGAGILKSTDGGATWTQILGPFLRDKIGTLAIHPKDGKTLLAASSAGLWRSPDAGESWIPVISAVTATSVLFDPTDGSSAYAALGATGGSTRNGVYHSTDGGLTWQKLTGGGFPATNVGRISLAMAASQPSIIYAQVQDSSSAGFGNLLGIWKTVDGGATWNKLPGTSASVWGPYQWYTIPIAVSPADPNIVFSGGLLIQRSLDGGNTWSQLAQTGASGQVIHVDEHVFVFTADATRLYIGNDGGAYSTTDITANRVSWTDLNSTLAITQFYPGMSMHPTDPLITLAGAQDNGTQRFTGGPSWSNITCGDGGYTSIDASVPTLFFGVCQNIQIEKTLPFPGAIQFTNSVYGIDQNDQVAFIAPFVLDPSNPQTAYFGTYRLWRSTDSAGSWAPLSPDLTVGKAGTISTVAVAPSDSSTIYAGTSNGRIQVSIDAGATWKLISAGQPTRAITSINVDPVDASVAYVTYSGFVTTGLSGHVFKTKDRGTSWTDISGNLPNLPVNGLAVDPDLPETLYIATDSGVMITTDGGTNWSVLGNGLPKVVVSSLVLHRRSRILRAATHGRSVWDLAVPVSTSLQPTITSLTPSTANAGDAALKVAVNGSRFNSSTVIRWNGQNRTTNFVDASHVTVEIPASDLQNVGRATVLAFDPSGGASVPASFVIGPAPKTTSDQFVSSANPAGGSALGQRSLGALYGTNLAPGTFTADTPPLPFTLGGVSLLIGNNPTPLLYVSPTVILFQVPFLNLIAPTKVPLVLYQGTLSTTIDVTVQQYSPGLFSMNGGGTGQGAILVAGTASIAAPKGAFDGSRPVHIGEYISIYCTGLGDTTPRPALGAPSGTSPLSQTLVKPTVTIGGVPATVSFSGLVPGRAGLYVVNVQVPDTAPTGDQIEVVLKIAGFTSNTVNVSVDTNPNAQ